MKKLDKIDRKLLYLLDRNSRSPLSTLSRKTSLTKEALHYRLRNLKEHGFISKFYTIINPAKFGFYFFKIYLQLQNTTEEIEHKLIDYLQAHSRYGWSCFCSGRWDMIIGIWAEDPIDFESFFLSEFLEHFGDYILAKEVSTTKYNIQQNRHWLAPHDLVNDELIPSVIGGKTEQAKLDETDHEILRIIANNARMPITKIATLAKTTQTVVTHRIRNLEREGIILAYRINFDLENYGYVFCKAFIYLKNTDQKRIKQFVEYCKENKNIRRISTTFGRWDAELEFEVPNFEYFHGSMREMKHKFGDLIKSYDTVLISHEYKADFMPASYPPFEGYHSK